MDFRVAPQAESDLDEIWYFLATQSSNRAKAGSFTPRFLSHHNRNRCQGRQKTPPHQSSAANAQVVVPQVHSRATDAATPISRQLFCDRERFPTRTGS